MTAGRDVVRMTYADIVAESIARHVADVMHWRALFADTGHRHFRREELRAQRALARVADDLIRERRGAMAVSP